MNNTTYQRTLSAPMIKFMISIFYSFVHSRSSLGILLNFDPLRSIQCTYFGPLFKWIYGQHKFSLLQFLVENCIKWQHILKNTAQIKIIITISVENCTNSGAKIFVFLRANCCTNCYYAVFLRIWCHLLQFSMKN